MVKVEVSSMLQVSDQCKYYVDRIGKFGSYTYVCENLEEAFQKVGEVAQMDNVLAIYVWN